MAKLTKSAWQMLERIAEAGDIGIYRRFVPVRICNALEERGFIVLVGTTVHITEIGRAVINDQGTGDER